MGLPRAVARRAPRRLTACQIRHSLACDEPAGQAHRLAARRGQDAPFSQAGRLEAGHLLRLLQKGHPLSLPHSRPLPAIGQRCHELRVPDGRLTWRLIYRLDADAVVIVEVFAKKTAHTSNAVITTSRARLREYDDA